MHIYIVCTLVLYTAQKNMSTDSSSSSSSTPTMDPCSGEWNIELSLIHNNVKDIDTTLLMIRFGKYVWFSNDNTLNIDE